MNYKIGLFITPTRRIRLRGWHLNISQVQTCEIFLDR
jgi:hypothetical protein